MHVKRFEATSMEEVLRQVRETLGPDALVLSTRSLRRRRGRFGLLGRSVVEVVAAMERTASGGSQARPEQAVPDPSWAELGIARALVTPIEDEVGALRTLVHRLAATPPAEVTIAAEVEKLRRIADDLNASHERDAGAVTGRAAGCCLAAGLAARHARALADDTEGDISRGDDWRTALALALASRLDARLRPAREDDPLVRVLVGPAGAGKTTTLAKVAARSTPEDLAVISTDVHRVGGTEPLRQLSRSLRVPFTAAPSIERLAATVDQLGSRRVLVDTAGRSPRDPDAPADLARLRDALGERAQFQLVLPATTKEQDLRTELERYSGLGIDAMVVTKTDQSGDLANVVNILLDEAGPPLQWLADGQRVPEDLVVPDPLALAQQVLGIES